MGCRATDWPLSTPNGSRSAIGPPRLVGDVARLIVIDALHELVIAPICFDVESVEFFEKLFSSGDPIEGSAAHAEFGKFAEVQHIRYRVHRLEIAHNWIRVLLGIRC